MEEQSGFQRAGGESSYIGGNLKDDLLHQHSRFLPACNLNQLCSYRQRIQITVFTAETHEKYRRIYSSDIMSEEDDEKMVTKPFKFVTGEWGKHQTAETIDHADKPLNSWYVTPSASKSFGNLHTLSDHVQTWWQMPDPRIS